MTNEERNKYLAGWREKNRQKIREQHRAWYASHKHDEKLIHEKRRFFKLWAERNREHLRAYQRITRQKDKERIGERKRAWYAANREKVREMRKHELDKPNARLALYLRSRLRLALINKRAMKRGSLIEMLGANIPAVMAHLEQRFSPGMAWDNYGEWHVDHIRPLSRFDLTQESQQRIAMHYTNLQPLWAKDNLKKSNKIYDDRQEHDDLASRPLRIAGM